jgi:hypothetical protein
MTGPLGPNAFYAYTSDDLNAYQIRTRAALGTADGATPITVGSIPTIPKGYHPRHVWGKESGGTRKKLICMSQADPLYTDPGQSFSVDGKTWVVEGRIGERRFTGA